MRKSLLLLILAVQVSTVLAQTGDLYVDKKGTLRYKKGQDEAAFFGVNYTLPFAYAYRSHRSLGVDWEQAIDQDVYHLARMGADAFRVHVWDTEITDSLGNLLANEHLRLYDYLLARLQDRGIKIIITPIAFWGNGYPEPDDKTPGFSHIYPKREALVNEKAIKAQENYMRQFFKHINPYTRLDYQSDPDVLAVEINNEPHHSGPKGKVTEYVNRMARSIRNSGWTKPVFYNISESPAYADAVSKADIDGVSFQWYPTNLVAGHEQKGNFLPYVDQYFIPFGDTIPAFASKARMVYEFDAGDVLGPYMYPAMARSFRTAGFQWATQFAYDPLATAYANTEYQTHYLNLAYTPGKAISFLIASKAFHRLPRGKSYGSYPADTLFDAFRVSYSESLSEMNTPEEFYYSNTTATRPVDAARLQHVAGVGSSPVVRYTGYGAYFLDQLESGVWRLEVMPDAILVRDPFEKASLQKTVSAIQWRPQQMALQLPDLGADFAVRALDAGNTYSTTADPGGFGIQPGTYLLLKNGHSASRWTAESRYGNLQLGEFVAPKPSPKAIEAVHTPCTEVSSGRSFPVRAILMGVEPKDAVTLYINKLYGEYKSVAMQHGLRSNDFEAWVPADLVTPGLLNYSIVVQKSSGEYFRFPGGTTGPPFA
ncbi:MAG: cellulase family glycosylhydrolase, partial [Saprospiraceae bacterium]